MLNGVINVYKEKDYTSHDVIARLRGILKQKKIGHTGTLDPDATGVLPVCLGKATKLCDMITDKDKTYSTVLLLGIKTDTQDISGSVIEDKSDNVLQIKENEIVQVIESFVGEYSQIPPMYSALKVDGKKLYELAREGKEIERQPRAVKIYSIRIDNINLPRVTMTVKCSKGTYIRTLCDDIGNKIGCGACVEELTRTKVSNFEIDKAMTLSEIEDKRDCIQEFMIPIDEMFLKHTKCVIDSQFNKLLYNGNKLDINMLQVNKGIENFTQSVRIYDSEGRFVGIYKLEEDGVTLKPEKMFLDI